MNFLPKLLSNSSQPRRTIFLLLQQSLFFCTRTAKPKEPKSPTASYVLNPVKIQKESGSGSSWRRPSEIPFQGKAANSVKFVGVVKSPVQFQTLSDGKCVAATVIVQENGGKLTPFSGNNSCVSSFLIPVVFEGDLAHVVKCHVKEDDSVFVSGQLSADHLPFSVGGYEGNFHIVARDVYFVECNEKTPKSNRSRAKKSDLDDAPELEMENREFVVSDDSLVGVENGDQNGGNGSSATSDQDWWDLIKNSVDWRDYRASKSEGRVKPRHPDFKHKMTGVALWLVSAPKWAVIELEGVELGSKEVVKVKSDKEMLWKSLVENPKKWWDNRSSKKNEKQPDFRCKESGEALWLNSAPDWAVSKLPPLPDKKVASPHW